MSYLNEAWLKNKILKYCADNPEESFDIETIRADILPEHSYDHVVELLRSIRASDPAVLRINITRDADWVRATGITKQFLENGGFEKGAQKKEMLEKKLRNDARLSAWKVWVFWPAFVLGTFGGVYSMVDLIKNLTKSELSGQLQKSKSHMESEGSKPHTSASGQKKDSLLFPSSSYEPSGSQ